MSFLSILPFLIGMITVLQSSLNKKISMSVGVASAVFINSALILVISIAFFYLQKYSFIPLAESLRSETLFGFKKWWIIVPALCGFMIVLGFPLALTKMGASQVFVLAVAGQCVASLLWDTFVDGRALELLKVVGVLTTLVGAFLVSFK
jgi:transporter family-2 protein